MIFVEVEDQVRLLIQFTKIHLIGDIFLSMSFPTESDSKVVDKLFSTIRFFSRIRHVIPFHTHARATSDQEENCFHFPSMFEATFLRNLTHPAFRGKWREWEKKKREEREKRWSFFSGPWRVESARLKYRAGGIMLRQRWVNGDVDRRKFHSAHGRARRSMFQLGKKMEKSVE